MKIASKQDILNHVSIVDVANSFGVDMMPLSAGDFDFRCRCPSPAHKSGHERTSSLFISSRDNSFWCYGCLSGTNVIDFYMLCADCSFSVAIDALRPLVDENLIGEDVEEKIKYNGLPFFLEVSKFFRNLFKKFPDEKDWIEQLMEQTDRHLFAIEHDDIPKVQALLAKIKGIAQKKFGEQ